jgi:hypothetical protein
MNHQKHATSAHRVGKWSTTILFCVPPLFGYGVHNVLIMLKVLHLLIMGIINGFLIVLQN